MKSTPILQESYEFVRDFIREAKCAKKSIYVQTMFFEPGPVMANYEKVFAHAVRKGITVQFVIDWVTENYFDNNMRLYPRLNKKWYYWKIIHHEREKILERFSKAGIKVRITNRPSFLQSFIPMAGRNHNKIFAIDAKIAWIGGVNLSAELEGKDIMVKFTKKNIVTAIVNEFLRLPKNAKEDLIYHCDKNNDLLIDAGIRGKSIILDEALRSIDNAKKEIILISQFVADKPIIHALLKKAKEGISIRIITGDKHFDLYRKFPDNVFYLLLKQKIYNNKNIQILHYRGRVHAKVLEVDNAIAIFGSHNFVGLGVILGTREIAVKTTDKKLLTQIHSFTNKLLHNAALPD